MGKHDENSNAPTFKKTTRVTRMNIILSLQSRISKRLEETKSPCKTYKTIAAAEKVAAKTAQKAAAYFDVEYQFGNKELDDVRPARYVIFHIAKLDRYGIGFDQTEIMSRKDFAGGYIGMLAQEGHYTY